MHKYIELLYNLEMADNQVQFWVPQGENPLFQSIFPQKLKKGDIKKIEIIEATVKLVAVHGFEETTYDLIAQALGTRRSHVAYHYKDRQELYISMVKFMMAKGHDYTFQLMQEASEPKEMFKAYLAGYFNFFVDEPEYIPVILYFYYSSGFNEEFRSLQTQVRQGAFQRIKGLIVQMLKAEEKSIPRNLDDLVNSTQSMILGRMIFNVTTGQRPNLENTELAKSHVLIAVEKMFRLKF